MTLPSKIDLSIRGENIQQMYGWYLNDRLLVNRRYQRKLVWTREEKIALIDSIMNGYPLPLILLAELGGGRYEIIDGMQRLNAIFSFIEDLIPWSDRYFDLEATASTKQLSDEGKLGQVQPKLDRGACTMFANYNIPVSAYRLESKTDVDEIFRRINSYGHQLSEQEIRQAGVTGPFADVVRELSTSIRGDVSHEPVLPLRSMAAVSITNRDLEYGIKADDIFWVKNEILRREEIRSSKDEDLIADLVAYAVAPADQKPPHSSAVLDQYYGLASGGSEEDARKALDKKRDIDVLVGRDGPAAIQKRVLATHDLLIQVLQAADTGFGELIGKGDRAPKYYQVIFWAVYELLFVEKLQLKDLKGVVKALRGIADHIQMPTGGNWSASSRQKSVDSVKGIIKRYFAPNPLDPMAATGRTEFENLITKARTEASAYDFKQGFHRLDKKAEWDEGAFQGVLATICGMANLGPGRVGYVIVGVLDKSADAKRLKELTGTDSLKAGAYWIGGLDHEAVKHTNLDKYAQYLAERISKSELTADVRVRVASNLQVIDYQGKSVLVVKVEPGPAFCSLGDKVFRRDGAQTKEVAVRDLNPIVALFK